MTTYKSMVLRALSIIDHLQANERDCKPDTVKATLHELMAPSGWPAPKDCPTRAVAAPPTPSGIYRTQCKVNYSHWTQSLRRTVYSLTVINIVSISGIFQKRNNLYEQTAI